jgi:glutathione reductase (NADPH)
LAPLDLFVIGGGSGGVAAARRAASYGASVGICEASRYGGTCVVRGCVPKKLMHYAASVPHAVRVARDYGWELSDPRLRWAQLQAVRNRETARLEGVYQSLLDKAGVERLTGRGRILGRDGDAFVVEVGEQRRLARRVLIAVGARAEQPEIPGLELAVTSDAVVEGEIPFPRRVAVLGAGYIGVELAGILNGCGAEVTVVLRGDQPLRGFDDDLRSDLTEQMTRGGIRMLPLTRVDGLERTASGIAVRGPHVPVEADLVIAALGRKPKPNTASLGLAELGVRLTANGAAYVDVGYETNVKGIFAVGDCCDHGGNALDGAGFDLTPIAIAEGRAFAERQFNQNPQVVRYDTVPTAVFSEPELGTVGLSEARARALGYDVAIYRTRFKPMRYTLGDHHRRTLMKLVVDRDGDRVLGCHMVGDDAAEIIQGLAVALTAGATKAQFDETVALHPTAAEEFVTMYQPAAS